MTVSVLKDMKLDFPRIETKTHWITMGMDKDLNAAMDFTRKQTVKFLAQQRGITEAQAAALMPKVSDCRVSQVVNIKKGIHCLNPKDTKATGIPPRPTAETKTDYVTHVKDADLNKAMDGASMAMIKFLEEKKGVARLDAYGLASVAMDCRVGDVSGTEKNVHCLVPKSLWRAK